MALPAKGIHRVKAKLANKTRVEYHYAWRGGPKFWTSTSGIAKHSPDYWAAYHDACAERRPDRGLFREVLNAYLNSPQFKKLGARTQKDKRTSIFHPKNGIEQRFGDAPLGVFARPEIRRVAYEWLDDIDSDRVSDMRRADLVSIVAWAVDRGYLTAHHLQRMTPRYTVDRSEIIWSDAEIDTFVALAPDWIGRILIAATETGLRPGDLIRLNRGHVQGTAAGQRRIFMRTAKRGKVVSIPVTPKMGELIDATPRDRLHILANASGGPFVNTNYPMKKVRDWRRKAGLRDELHLHDARGTAATRLFEADASLREIATHMGWSVQHTAKMIEVYVSRNPSHSDDLLIRLHRDR
jgi:integrase